MKNSFPPISVFFLVSNKFKANYNPFKSSVNIEIAKDLEVATFAGGCFWCTEAIFLELDGVKTVVSGYIGGSIANPTYDEVSSGTTGHAEAVQIIYNPKKITFKVLLKVFFATHNPTTLNRQGADLGIQYRSEVFYQNKNQRKITENYIAQMTAFLIFDCPIVTKVSPASIFYPAENYHQNVYNQNKNQPYCHFIITPKIEKLKLNFQNKLKK